MFSIFQNQNNGCSIHLELVCSYEGQGIDLLILFELIFPTWDPKCQIDISSQIRRSLFLSDSKCQCPIWKTHDCGRIELKHLFCFYIEIWVVEILAQNCTPQITNNSAFDNCAFQQGNATPGRRQRQRIAAGICHS